MTVDTVFALMGPTGSGKSNFINQLIGIPERKTASGLRSDTQGVEEYRMNTSKGQFVFADTPGFDDTHRSDQDILRIIAAWLEDKYRGEVKLSGIIYTHRITERRLSGSVCKNLDIFGRLCGNKAAQRVRLVTTMWDRMKEKAVAERKVSELVNNFWKPLIDEGARHMKFENTSKSAWDVIRDVTGETEVLLLQEELVDAKRKLNETAAGKLLCSQYQKRLQEQREAMKQLEEAMLKDPAKARESEGKYKKIEAQLQKTMQEMDELKIGWLRGLGLKFFSKKTRSHAVEVKGNGFK